VKNNQKLWERKAKELLKRDENQENADDDKNNNIDDNQDDNQNDERT
jgi:hypothetical protein